MNNAFKVQLIGTRPLMMHADTFADPINPLTKQHKKLTSKRNKTDDDHEAIAKSEWRGALYFDDDIGPYMPGVNIEASMIEGGKLSKLGTKLKRGVEVIDEYCKLEYEGPRTVQALWDKGFYDARSVKVQRARLMRYRPLFRKWSLTCNIAYDPEAMDYAEIVSCLTAAGQYCGIGDYRPKFGRFTVEVLK